MVTEGVVVAALESFAMSPAVLAAVRRKLAEADARDFAGMAPLLRVAAGAGKPDEVPGQTPLKPLMEGYVEEPAQVDPDARPTTVGMPFKPREKPKS